jgi:hypothetical protein
MFKIAGVVIWVTPFAVVLSSVIRTEKTNATPQSARQVHYAGKMQH